MRFIYGIILVLICAGWGQVHAQDSLKRKMMNTSLFDTSRKPKPVYTPATATRTLADTPVVPVVLKRPVHDPNKATIRSAILPGWGQIYNREYWKLPLVYGALAIPTATFFFNNSYYQKTKFAYSAMFSGNQSEIDKISADVRRSDGSLLTLDQYQNARNAYRQARDYSVLWFLIVWGINVVDATVFGHLRTFDVSDDLSLQVAPTFNSTLRTPGIGLVLSYKKPAPRYSLSALSR